MEMQRYRRKYKDFLSEPEKLADDRFSRMERLCESLNQETRKFITTDQLEAKCK